MIFFNQAEIMFGFVGIPAVLLTLHKLYPAITCEKFNAGIAGSLFLLPRSCFAGMNFSHVIVGVHLYRVKKFYMFAKKNWKKMYANLNKYQVEICPALLRVNLITPCNRRVKFPVGQVDISFRQTGIMFLTPSIRSAHVSIILLYCVTKIGSIALIVS